MAYGKHVIRNVHQEERLAKSTSSIHELHPPASPSASSQSSSPSRPASNRAILIDKSNVPWPLRISSDKLLIARRPLIFCITGQHALEAHAYRLHILDGRPALRAEQVETDDAVGVDVRVDGDGTEGLREVDERNFGRFYKF